MGASSSKDLTKSNNKILNTKINNNDYNVNTFNNKTSKDITNIKNDVLNIKKQISSVNLPLMNSDISAIKSDISFIKSELSEIKSLILSCCKNKNQAVNNMDKDLINPNKINSDINNFNNFDINLNNKTEKKISLKNKNKKEISDSSDSSDSEKIKEKNDEIKLTKKIINNNIFKPNNTKIVLISNKSNKKTVIISMNDKDQMIQIDNNINLQQFKSIAKSYFTIYDYTKIYYISNFYVKKYIQTEFDFKDSLNKKVYKYYFINEEKNNNLNPNLNYFILPSKKEDFIPNINNNINNNFNNNIINNMNNNMNNNINNNYNFNNNNNMNNNINSNNFNNNKNYIPMQPLFNNNNGFQPVNNPPIMGYNNQQQNNNNIININQQNIPNKKNKIIQQNNFISNNNSNIDSNKKEVSDIIKHFASLAFIQGNIDKGDFINSAVYISDKIKQINDQEKLIYPYKFHDSKVILKYPGLISSKFDDEQKLFILSLISDVLEEKGISVSIYKKGELPNNLDGASLQYLFNGFTEKKKYEIHFKLEPEKNNILLQKGDDLTNFIDEWKTKISNHLNIDKTEIFLVNPKDKKGLCLDLVTNEGSLQYKKLKQFKEIKNIEEKSLIEGCQLNIDIFDPAHNNQDPGWGKNETRGGEKYLPPEGWYGYGLKVGGKYDNGDNTWLDYYDHDGVFAVAYLGLSNIYGNKKNLSHFMNEINSQEALKIGYEQTYKNDLNIKDKSKNEYQKCGNGVYLYQNPTIAENTASIIDIGGVRYKILLMCRVNPYKIRQPQGFPDCWILNPTPSEVRPYRILIKKIFQSPMAGASQNEIKTFDSNPDYYMTIINKKDTTFFNKNKSSFNNDDFVINLYTSNEYIYINNYLREGKIMPNSKYTEKEIQSWAWCLHNALTTRKSNVSNGTTFYRGVSRKFPSSLGVGSKFILAEFTSVSEDKKIALSFSGGVTLLIVRIENNDPSHYYCYDVNKLSMFSYEKEILITSNCTFQITKKNQDSNDSVEEIYLTCEGYKVDNTKNANSSENKFILNSFNLD